MRHLQAWAISLCILAPGAYGQAADPQQALRVTRSGSQPARSAPPANFTGAAKIDSAFSTTPPARLGGARVTFEPSARTDWHTHPLGQTLIVTSGTGRVQRWGDPIEEIRQGDIVWIPPGQKHWHGAGPQTVMTHIAIAEHLDGKTVDWMEKVTDAQYAVAAIAQSSVPAGTQPTRAQQLMGDIAPKLADLTDKVLFADVWERPQLSPRDRSLATVAALIAMNRPDQLRSHLARARANGLTQEQLVEVITHLAFYAGWPNAISAVGVAREVFKEQ
jgi:4-carboxymuconolactone decarboxylase